MPMILRNTGYAKEAGIGVALGGIVNIVLDPLFMFCLLPDGYQVLGAGIATMLSNVISLAYFVFVFWRVRDTTVLELPRRLEHLDAQSRASIYSVGVPAALVLLLFNSLGVVLNRLAVSYGDVTLAAVGIVMKLERMPQNIGVGICLGMVPLVAYNFARGNLGRMDGFFKSARLALLVVGLTSTAAYFLFAEPIVGLFIRDAETVRLGTAFLKARSLSLPFMLIGFEIVHYMQAVGQGRYSLILTVLRHLVLSIPIMVGMNALFGLDGLIWSQTVADVVNAALAVTIYLKVRSSMGTSA
jgi:Na+-driven multidrug efflux pump